MDTFTPLGKRHWERVKQRAQNFIQKTFTPLPGRPRLGAGFRRILEKIRRSNFYPVRNLRPKRFAETFRSAMSALKISNGVYTHFAVELFLLLIVGFTAGTNLYLRTNSGRPSAATQSLFFVYLKQHPKLNPKLVNAYEDINLKLSMKLNPGALPNIQQVLGASTAVAAEDKHKADNAAAPLPSLSGSTLLKPNPSNSNFPANHDTEVYKVKPGDTVSRIALAYGVSIDTILWENNLAASTVLKPDQELKILPVSGVEHTVKPGETVFSIAKKYGVDPIDILDYNNIEIADYIQPGDTLIIPNGVKQTPPSPARKQYLADLQREDYKKVNVPDNYVGSNSGLIWPMPAAHRLSQGYWSGHRGIDIPCRDCSIVAAADGIVEISGWQGGYGNTIVINHGGGIKTRYAHGKELLVTAGQSVTQGQAIMISGSTGRSTGPHLHFEVKKNNQYVSPLNVVPH